MSRPARRPATATAAALAATLTAAAAPGVEPIPPHPRELSVPLVPVRLPDAEGRRHPLPAGAVAYVVEERTLPLVEIAIALPAGDFLDPPERTGLASLTAALLTRGGAGTLSADRLPERADELGVRLGSPSLPTHAGITLSAPSWTLDGALDLLFSMLTEPRFERARFETAVANLREAIGHRNQDPLSIVEREWQRLLIGSDHFSSRHVTTASLAAIDRDDLLAFHRRYWRPQGAVVAVSGDVETAAIVAELRRRLEAWAAIVEEPPAAAPWPPPAPEAPPRIGLFHAPFDGPQAKVALGLRLPRRPGWTARDRFALQLALEILGGKGAISRLGGRLRSAEGLAYRVVLDHRLGVFWPGDVRIFFDTASVNTPRALAAALEEIDRLRDRLVRPQELAVARTTLLSRLRLTFDTAEEVAGTYALDRLLGRPHEHWQAQLDVLPTLTADEVRAAAREFLDPERLTVLVVGRWPELAGDGEPTELERVAGRRVEHLPPRDPFTLLPVVPGPADAKAAGPSGRGR